MNLYTFIFEYRGGSYTSQHRGEDVDAALNAWAEKEVPTVYEIKPKHIKDIRAEIANKNEEPVVVGAGFIKNVWYMSFLSGNTNMRLMIVRTDDT